MKPAKQWAMDEPGIYPNEAGELSGFVEYGAGSFVEIAEAIQADALKWASEQVESAESRTVAYQTIVRKIKDCRTTR